MAFPFARHCGLSATLLLTLSAWAPAQAAAPAAPVVATLKLQAQAQGQERQWEGVIQAVRQSTVAAQVPGNVTALLVKAGDTVKAGQVLARIDARDTSAGLLRSQADVAQAEAQFNQARMQWERSQQLRAQGFISEAALDSARTQWQAAQAGVAAARAGRSQAALAQGFTTVTAPFDGRVLNTHVEVGDLAAPGRPVLTLYAPRPLRAVVQVPASQADAVRTAQRVEVEVPTAGGQAAWLKPTQVISLPGADPVSQTVEWRLDLPEVSTLPGQTVRVRFADLKASSAPTAGASAPAAAPLTVPAQAVLRRGELTAVYVVRGDRFMLQAVRTGTPASSTGPVTLLSGVRPGDVIAADALKAGLANATPAKP